MKTIVKALLTCFFIISNTAFIFAQSKTDSFVSPSGGFRIDLPKAASDQKESKIESKSLTANGIIYSWVKTGEYYFEVRYYLLQSKLKPLTPSEKNIFMKGAKDGLLETPKKDKIPYIEREFALLGNQGLEIQCIYPKAKSISRFIIINKRFYNITFFFDNKLLDENELLKILNSFSLLDPKSLIAAKIEEAMPDPLPQSPVIKKLRSDTEDKGLKGKVKSVITDNQDEGKHPRERYSEEYFDESGNLLKEIAFYEGYPTDITVWGYLNGKRVSNSNEIYFDDDQKPPPRNFVIRTVNEAPADPSIIRDERYSSSYEYKYDESGQLVEKKAYSNTGELWQRIVYKNKGFIREEIHYGNDGKEWSNPFYVLDDNGNTIEEYYLNRKGKKDSSTIYRHELDSNGNWIKQTAIEKITVKGKVKNKVLWISYRTIDYYP